MRILKYKLLILSLLFLKATTIFAQNSELKNLIHEDVEISAGAEYSIMSEQTSKFIYSGNAEFQKSLKAPSDRNPIYSISPLLGINFNSDAALSGSYHIPPDPIGVAGPSHLVAVNNTSIRWSAKDGSSAVSKRLGKNSTDAVGSFFESLSPINATFDPKVIYDQYNDRFVVVTLEKSGSVDNDAGNVSRILLAVSATNDPNGTWYYHSINSKITISSIDSWADYPGFAISSDAIFVTANMFRFSGGTSVGERVWIIQKGSGSGGFYDGGAASDAVYDAVTSSGGYNLTIQPAHMFGSAPTNVVTFLVGYGGLTDGTNEFVQIIVVTGTSSSPTFSTRSLINMGDIDDFTTSFPTAPQSGTAQTIATNDRRTLHAVWRNNYLYSTETVVPPSGDDASQATSHWSKFNASTSGAPTLADQGICGGEDIATGTYTFMSSIAVNSNDAMVIGFAASASSIYPGAYYAGRVTTDAAGTTPHTGTLAAGEDYYYRAFGGSRNRWGDYSGISVDPSDDVTFWLFNQYATTRGTILGSYPTEDGVWATAFGKIVDAPLPVELRLFTATAMDDGVVLKWQTATEVNNYGFEVARKNQSISPSLEGMSEGQGWVLLGFVEGHGNSNSPKSYEFIDTEAIAGKLQYRLKQIDTDGSFEYYGTIAEMDFNITGIQEYAVLPTEYSLSQNYPNPFNPTTTIRYTIPLLGGDERGGFVSLKVYDLLGREVATLVNEQQQPGYYEVQFNGDKLASGIYLYKLQSGSYSSTKKLMLLK